MSAKRSHLGNENNKDYLREDVLGSIGEWGLGGQADLRPYVFYSRIIYKIREIINSHDLDVSWGHPINAKGEVGPESDIIIFRGEPESDWNGFGLPPVIRIVLVDLKNIVLIIECKKRVIIDRKDTSRIKSQDECRRQFRGYVDFRIPQKSLWLLSENIYYEQAEERGKIKDILENQIGYSKFFYLFDEKKKRVNDTDWISFLSRINRLR